MFPRSFARITIPQGEAIANQKPAKRARKLPLVNHPPDPAPSNATVVGPGSVAAATVPCIREAEVAEGRIE